MLFNQYRIPRTNLLMKYCQVSKEGNITLSGDPRLMFAVMLCMRMWIVCIVWRFSAYASIIAGRYSVTRRQFLTLEKGNKVERKLLDYQPHAVKLVGALAQSLTMNFAQNHLNDYYFNFIQNLYGGSEDFGPLKIIHHFASGLKSYYTNTVNSNLTMLREACGGAGFHAYSGLPYLYTEHTAYVAFEGDNTVLVQQCGK